jgi:hypothetical protein
LSVVHHICFSFEKHRPTTVYNRYEWTATSFATGISFQPIIQSMTFDNHDNLYATLEADNTILIFDKQGNSGVFANASDGLNFPGRH